MKRNFCDVMNRRSDLLHQSAIWQEVLDHLIKFLDTDAIPATVGIRTDGGGMTVPQDRIEIVLNEIKNGYMAEIKDELDKINKSEVAEHVEQKQHPGKKKVPIKKEAKKVKGKPANKAATARSKPNKRKVGARK